MAVIKSSTKTETHCSYMSAQLQDTIKHSRPVVKPSLYPPVSCHCSEEKR